MIPALYGPVSEPVAALGVDDDVSVANPLRLLMADPDAELVFVLVAALPDTGGAPAGPPYAVMSVPLMALEAADEDLAGAALYLSDVGWQTEPDDTPANRVFPPRLTVPYNFETTIPLDGSGRGGEGFGVIEIANPDGAEDALLDRAWTGRRIEIRVGGTLNVGRSDERRLAFAEFGTLFVGTADAVRATDTTIEIALRDPMSRLESAVQQRLYAGTGGLEGGDDLAGLPKPLAYGKVRNVAPPLVVAASLVFQVHDGPVLAIDAVRDNGAALALAADHASSAALLAATIPAGSYATCLAEGLIRLGATAAGQVTADVRGDASGAGYVATAGAILRRLATGRGAQPLIDPDEIDAVAFAAVEAAAPHVAGLWTGTEPRTVADLAVALMASVGGWVSFDRTARLTVGLLAAPAAPVIAHSDATMANGVRAVDLPEPVWRVVVGYRRNWAPQPADGLAASLSDAERQEFSQPERSTATESSSLRTVHPAARELRLSTLLDEAADAAAVGARLLELFKRRRRIHMREVARPLFQFRVGETHRLVEDRFGLDAGGDFIVAGLAEDARRRVTTLTLWG